MNKTYKAAAGSAFLVVLFLLAIFLEESRPVAVFTVLLVVSSSLVIYSFYNISNDSPFSPTLTGIIHPSEKFFYAQSGKVPSEHLLKGNSSFIRRTSLQTFLSLALLACEAGFIIVRATRPDEIKAYVALGGFVFFYAVILFSMVTKSWKSTTFGYNFIHMLCCGLVGFLNVAILAEAEDIRDNVAFLVSLVLATLSLLFFVFAYLGEVMGKETSLYDDEADETRFEREKEGSADEFSSTFIIVRSIGLLGLDASLLAIVTALLLEVAVEDNGAFNTDCNYGEEEGFWIILLLGFIVVAHMILLTVTQTTVRTLKKRSFLKIYFGLKMSAKRVDAFSRFYLSTFAEYHINIVSYIMFPAVLIAAYARYTRTDNFVDLECIGGVECTYLLSAMPVLAVIGVPVAKLLTASAYVRTMSYFLTSFDYNRTWRSFLPRYFFSFFTVLVLFTPFDGEISITRVCLLQETATIYIVGLVLTALARLICERWESEHNNLITVRNRQFLPVERLGYNNLSLSAVVDDVQDIFQKHPRKLNHLECRILVTKARILVERIVLDKSYPNIPAKSLTSVLLLFDILNIGLNLNHNQEDMDETWNEIGNEAAEILSRCLEAFLTNDTCIRGTYRILTSLRSSARMKAKVEQMYHLVFETAVDLNVALPEVPDVSSTTYKAYQKTIQLIKLNTFYAVNIDFLFSHSIVDVDDLLTLRHLTDRSTMLIATSSVGLQNFSKILLDLKLPDFTVGSLNFRRPYKNLTELILIGSERVEFGSNRDTPQEEFRIGDKEGLAISCMVNLQLLNLANQDLTSAGIEEWGRLKKLTHLYLPNNNIDSEGTRVIRTLPIEALDLTGNPITYEGLALISQMTTLRMLLIPKSEGVEENTGVDFADAGGCNCVELRDIFGLNRNNLRLLDVTGWDLGTRAITSFIGGSKHLLVLKAGENLLGGLAWRNIAPNRELFYLDLSENIELGRGKVGTLKRLTRLEHLDLERTGLGPKGLKACTPLGKLKEVNFANNNLDTNAIKYFSQYSKSKNSLTTLNLAMNGLSDEALDELGVFSNVENLNMSRNLLGTQSVRKLIASRRENPEEVLAKLKHLSLSGNVIDETLKDELVGSGIQEVELEADQPIENEFEIGEVPPKRSTRISQKSGRLSYKSYQSAVDPEEL